MYFGGIGHRGEGAPSAKVASMHDWMGAEQTYFILDLTLNNIKYYFKIPKTGNILHYIISKSDILEINCSSIALLEKCISQDTEPLQGAYDKI